MGSLTSRPRIPASVPTPRPQTLSAPQATPLSPAPEPTTGGAANATATSEQTATRARTSSLLARQRGRFGTVLTGFRGLLGLSDNKRERKTLLGQ